MRSAVSTWCVITREFGDFAPFEQLSSERFKAVIDTNFYGVVNVTRAALPIMRKQKSGCILQISSVGGRLGVPGNSPYHAAQWAIGGFTESLAKEVAPFGVKVCALEPGGIRTNWGTRATKGHLTCSRIMSRPWVRQSKILKSRWGHENSDPVKVAQVVLRLAASDCLPAHLLIGSDAVQHAGQAEATRAADAGNAGGEVSVSTDADAPRSMSSLQF